MIDRPPRDLDEDSSPTSWPGQESPDGAGAGPRMPDVTVPDDDQSAHHSATRRHAAGRRPSGAGSLLRETAIILVSAIVLSLLVKTFLVQAFFIPSQSMHDTLIEHDRILVSKLTPGPFDLRRGDIVVFKDPGGWLPSDAAPDPGPVRGAINSALTFIGLYPADANEHLVKRLIGLPGDHVSAVAGGPVVVNGEPLDEPYLAAGVQPSDIAFDITVPPNSIWVMGDNRSHSSDSRYNQGNPGGGSVPIDNVVGMAFVTVWPIERMGLLRNPTSTFADVPDQP
ncbi:signal peptidase I [Cellulomonas humilata]|uniref:Signal peptidase I n=1 Tax=Cellulomonas humilata TaxID=144055 RepID=A0ABU0EGE9_9CELL|nr:signal peptidase I [Cellulomonas humilata]MDQ0374297.1 signal peptidase I [Cellulomonas humilata]